MSGRRPPWNLPAAFLLALALLLPGCGDGPPALGHDAYVWQRRWQPPLAAALAESADLVGRWRVLAAEVDGRGRFQPMAVDFAALAASGRPAIPVVRIEAPLESLDQAQLIARIGALQKTWMASAARAAGLEIDHDCPTRQLAAYRDFLVALRPALAGGQSLSVTLLPDWLQAPGDLAGILKATDEAVLQLHSLHPASGQLFDPASARAWTAELARLAPRPFRVALPTYGSRLFTDERGRITGVESEVPGSQSGGREAYASPKAVGAFLRGLERRPPPKLAGIVWFRLPVAGDSRAWSAGTWRAVISGRELPVRLATEEEETRGERTVFLSNRGEMDAELPAALLVEKPCAGHAGQGPYALEAQGGETAFLRREKGLLRAGGRLPVGSLRCDGAGGKIHIQP